MSKKENKRRNRMDFRKAIVKELKKMPMTGKDLGLVLNTTPRTARKHAYKLVKLGKVKMVEIDGLAEEGHEPYFKLK